MCNVRSCMRSKPRMKPRTNNLPLEIALDGPSASGKSTVGAMLAERWDCDFLDTGMMYRAVTSMAIDNEIDIQDAGALGRLATSTDFAVSVRDDRNWRLMANGCDITDELYSDEVNSNVSIVSAFSEVRKALVRKQRLIASERSIVMAGRDIGTVVLVDAPIKIYLDASPATRARRRTQDADGNSQGNDYEEVLRSIQQRDEIDSNRADSPLRPASDAFIIATDNLNLDEVVGKIIDLVSSEQVGLSSGMASR